MVQFLLEKQVKMIVVACNTITVSCLDRLRESFPDIPIIGAVPVIKFAARVSNNRKIGVLSTTRTAESTYQQNLIHTFAEDCEVINEGTDMLVPLIEKRLFHEIEKILPEILVPFQKAGVDTIALGCTHYPFIEQHIATIMGENVHLLNSGAAIARHVRKILEHNHLFAKHEPGYLFYTTGDNESFKSSSKKLVNQAARDKIEQVETIILS